MSFGWDGLDRVALRCILYISHGRERGLGLLIRRRLLTGGDLDHFLPARQEGLDTGRVELPALVFDQIVSPRSAASTVYTAVASSSRRIRRRPMPLVVTAPLSDGQNWSRTFRNKFQQFLIYAS